MSCRVLVVEDEIFVAIEIESVLEDLGHRPVGIAPDSRSALELARDADVALVDLNLLDGPTGIDVGRRLAESGLTVVFMTANPAQLGTGVPGAIGVLPKPATEDDLRSVVQYAASQHLRREAPVIPARLTLFNPPAPDLGFA